MQKRQKKTSRFFPTAKWFVWLFYKKLSLVGLENLSKEPTIIVGNHSKMNGPIASEIYLPKNCYTWCNYQVMHLKEAPAYTYADFWSKKPKFFRPFYKALSYLIAPLCVFIFNNAKTIPVYHDAKVIHTFKDSVKLLQDGNHIVIFPEHDKEYNHILCDFQDRFIDVARLYYKRTKKELTFTPMYVAPALRQVHIGKPITFNSSAETEQERERIKKYLMSEITKIACSLPKHKVVTYNNISKRHYPFNRED